MSISEAASTHKTAPGLGRDSPVSEEMSCQRGTAFAHFAGIPMQKTKARLLATMLFPDCMQHLSSAAFVKAGCLNVRLSFWLQVSHHPTNGITFVSGGKWTTWREMAEDGVDQVVERHPDLKKKVRPTKQDSCRQTAGQMTSTSSFG